MSPEQRLRLALTGKTPDRVPVVPKIWVDLGAALTGTELRRVIEDPLTALRVIVAAAEAVGADAARQFHFPPRRTEEQDGRVVEVDARGRVLGRIDMAGGLATHLEDGRTFVLEDATRMAWHHYWTADEPFVRSIEEAGRIAVPTTTDLRELGWADRQKAIQEEVGDRLALIGDCSSGTLAFHVCMRGMERALFDLVEEPRLVHAVMDKGAAIAVTRGRLAIELGLKVLRLNDSVANMSVISPAHWREFVLPHMRDVCTELHRVDSQTLIYCHICGNVLPVLEDILATGIDCIGPLDPLGGFSAADARRVVGGRASLMGGVDTQAFVTATAREIEAQARACIEGAGPGGYVLGSGCVIPRTARPENLRALRLAAETAAASQGPQQPPDPR